MQHIHQRAISFLDSQRDFCLQKKNKVHIVRNIRKQLYVKKGQLFEQISVKLKKCNRILNLFLPIPLTWLQKTRTNNLKNFCF